MKTTTSIERLRFSSDRHERLVLADWYDDNRQPERAELLRGQVALADWLVEKIRNAKKIAHHAVRIKHRCKSHLHVPVDPFPVKGEWGIVFGSGEWSMPLVLEKNQHPQSRFLVRGDADSWRVAFAVADIITGMGYRLSEGA